jgi:hypothetical protein
LIWAVDGVKCDQYGIGNEHKEDGRLLPESALRERNCLAL